jgi:peptidyl-prolyl cis-trans isomerase D
MFDFIRTHNKTILWLIFIFILPGFFLFGIEGFSAMGEKSETVAVVDGRKIGQIEWDAAVKEDVDRIRQSAPTMDPKFFDTSEFRYVSLEQLVKRRVLATAAQKLHLEVSDQRLASELLQNPMLAALRLPNGKIDEIKYKELLAPQGLTPQGFEARVRSDLSVQQVLQSLAKSGMVPASLADVALNAYFEKREIQILKFTLEDFAKKVTPTDAQVEAFYKGNAPLFQAVEKAAIQYVTLDIESIKKTITLNDADVKSYYEQNGDRLSGAEERKASHILIAVAKSIGAVERQKAKKQAEDLLVQIKKSPASFADLAKKNSQDPVSAINGGDLGFFARGSMVKPFEDAVFSMQLRQVSDVVESDFGYHIIQLVEIKTPKKRSFADMRLEIEAELQKQLAQKKFSEAAEIFTNTVYEQSDSLKPVADKLKLDIQTAQNVTRQAPPNLRGVLANSKFLGALFSSDAIDKKRNTEAVEVGGNQLVAGRVMSYTPAQTLPLEDVKDRARALLVQRMSLDLARSEGLAKLAELTTTMASEAAPAQMSAPLTVSRDALQQQNPKLVDTVLRANSSKLPLWLGVDLGAEGYRVVRLNKIVDGTQTAVAQNRDQYLQIWSNAESTSYYEYLKDKFKVQIKVNKPDPKTNLKAKAT